MMSPETPWILLLLVLIILLALFYEWPESHIYTGGAAGVLILWFVGCQIRRKRGWH